MKYEYMHRKIERLKNNVSKVLTRYISMEVLQIGMFLVNKLFTEKKIQIHKHINKHYCKTTS